MLSAQVAVRAQGGRVCKKIPPHPPMSRKAIIFLAALLKATTPPLLPENYYYRENMVTGNAVYLPHGVLHDQRQTVHASSHEETPIWRKRCHTLHLDAAFCTHLEAR